jgi:signal transduction histidine kinase
VTASGALATGVERPDCGLLGREHVIPRSIRRRLPLSYAVIALVAALSLGAVLIAVLRGYYMQRELDYLVGNAQAVDDVAAQWVALGAPPSVLKAQLQSLAFLSQTRIRVLDMEEQIVADSGDPAERHDLLVLSMVRLPSFQQTVTQTFGAETYRSVIAVQDTLSGASLRETTVITTASPPDLWLDRDTMRDGPDLVSYLPAAGSPFGFNLGPEATSEGLRSGHVVRQPLHDPDGQPLGYVELSEGPAYGRLILERVAWGWGLSSGVAVLLAAGVGWLASRRITRPLSALTEVTTRMSRGDLGARARLDRQDELGELSRSFDEMAARVEDTVSTLRQFVADAAHELHTPLTALRTNLELAPDDPFVERAQAQVERLEKLTTGLLDLSRIEAAARDPSQTPVSLNEVAQQAAELYASQAEQAGLAFEWTAPESPIVVPGKAAPLREALGNVLDNAIKFTPAGGTVAMSLSREGRWAVLCIRDTGIGIPPEDLPYVFNRFHRGTNAAPYPGSGLGLAIAQAIAAGYGGAIEAENLAPGTAFVIRLPLHPPASGAQGKLDRS